MNRRAFLKLAAAAPLAGLSGDSGANVKEPQRVKTMYPGLPFVRSRIETDTDIGVTCHLIEVDTGILAVRQHLRAEYDDSVDITIFTKYLGTDHCSAGYDVYVTEIVGYPA